MALNKAAPAKARRVTTGVQKTKIAAAKQTLKPKSKPKPNPKPNPKPEPEPKPEMLPQAANDETALQPVAIAALEDFSKAAVEKPAAAKAKRKTKTKSKKAPSKRAQPKGLVQRVYNTIDGELSKLEAQIGASSQDRERASRALSQMVSSLEKAVEMQREIAKDATKGGNAKDKEALRHAEDLRKEIADRVEQLQLERASDQRSEDAD